MYFMVSYYFKVYIPSLDRRVSFHEINIRDWININKSILNNDYGEIIECFDLIINSSCIEKGLPFTLVDKVVILLAIRAYSISTFFDIKINDKDEQKDFDHKLEVNQILDSILRLPIVHKKTIDLSSVSIEYGIPFYPVKDANIINVADYIHCIRAEDKILVNHETPRSDVQQIVDSLDIQMFSQVSEYARDVNQVFQKNPLYVIKSPWNTTRELIKQKMMLDFTMYDL